MTPEQQRLFDRTWTDPNSGCWFWDGATVKSYVEYGQLRRGNRGFLAHRYSWHVFRGPIPEGMHVCHKCDIGLCINPDHLFLGTRHDNMRDCAAKGRMGSLRGEDHPKCRLTIRQVLEARTSLLSERAMARKFGVSRSAISGIRRGRNWRHLPDDPERAMAVIANHLARRA